VPFNLVLVLPFKRKTSSDLFFITLSLQHMQILIYLEIVVLLVGGQDALNKSSFENYSSRARDSLACWMPDCIGFNLIEAVLCHICRKERPGAVLVFMTGWEDISSLRDQLKAHPLLGDPNRVLLVTCHGSMTTSEQVIL